MTRRSKNAKWAFINEINFFSSVLLQVGYYMVKAKAAKFPKVVFCDLTKLPSEVGFQRTFGSPGNLRHFAAFDASLGYLSYYRSFFRKRNPTLSYASGVPSMTTFVM